MFTSLTKKLQDLTHALKGYRTLNEKNIADALREVRLALLDADVNYSIVSKWVKSVKEKALGTKTLKGVHAGEQFIKIVHEELIALMGGEESDFSLKKNPSKILLCGLQGSGKTTHAAKLAYFLKNTKKKKPLLVALDYQRPAAIDQLKILGDSIDVPVFSIVGEKNPAKIAKKALKEHLYDVFIFDTAGRLHIDDALMKELLSVKSMVDPDEVIFVANSALGQDAVKTAEEFQERIGITGSILTMLDGSTRAGAALSIREVTQKPLLFEGVGERVEDLRIFNPTSMADRILGMGDVINLMKKVETQVSKDEQKKLEKKIRKAQITYNDYLKQMSMVKKMGPLKGILKMLPGVGAQIDLDESVSHFSKIEAMIFSMTPEERLCQVELIPGRRRRIAKGSGTSLNDVNRLVKQFKQLKKMSKMFSGGAKNVKGADDLEEMMKKFSSRSGGMNDYLT